MIVGPEDLDLVPIEMLREAILKRAVHGVIAVVVRDTDVHGEHFFTMRSWTGNLHTCAGLAADVQAAVLHVLHATEADIHDPHMESDDG